MIQHGIYEYKGKRYYATGTRLGAGTDKGRVFVDYKAMYRCDNPNFAREVEDFKAKFAYVGQL